MSLETHPQTFTAKLSPADQIAPLSHTNVMMTFPSPNPLLAASRLTSAIRTFCDQLPYMAGSISRAPRRRRGSRTGGGRGQGYTHLTWFPGDQVHLERKHPSKPLPSYPELKAKRMPLHDLEHDFRPTGIVSREYTEREGDVWPAMLACYTILEGGLVFCVALHHHFVGGRACATLLNRIASICRGDLKGEGDRGVNLDAMAPLGRWRAVVGALGVDIGEEMEGELEEEEEEFGKMRDVAEALLPRSVGNENRVDLAIRVFGIRRSALETLREALTVHIGGLRPSSTAVLTGLMWCAFNQARSRRRDVLQSNDGKSLSTLVMPVPANNLFDQGDVMRSRDFIGNLLSAAQVKDEVSTLAADNIGGWPAALPGVVSQLATALAAAQDGGLIQARLRQVMSVRDMRLLSQASSMGANDLLVTNWGGMPLHMDFGSEVGWSDYTRPMVAPITERTTSRSFYSYVVILPKMRRGDDEIIELVSCFERCDMAEIEQHPLLIRLQRDMSML